MKLKNEREKIVFEIKRMQEMGLVINTSGNISIKKDDLIAISPSGVSYDNLKSEDIVVLDKDKKLLKESYYHHLRRIFMLLFMIITEMYRL